MMHPTETDVALFAGGDLGFWSRRRISRHVAACRQCRAEVAAFQTAADTLRYDGAEIPPEVHWSRLATEMKANIRVGLAAGECVGPAPERVARFGWRHAAAMASLTLLVLVGWWLNLPAPQPVPSTQAGVVLEQTPAGIELQENGRALTLLVPRSQAVMLSVNAQGSLGARYVDTETGQVTVSNVYVQ